MLTIGKLFRCWSKNVQGFEFIFFQLVKFGIGADWQPLKYDVSVDMPQELDLSVLKGSGLQPGEEQLPEEASKPTSAGKF